MTRRCHCRRFSIRPGKQYQHSGRSERGSYQVQPSEEQLDLCLGCAFECVFSMTFLMTSPTKPVSAVAQMARMAKRLNASELAKIGPLPLIPEVDDDGEHRAGVQHHQQQRHLGR